jgi:hypothetical protein
MRCWLCCMLAALVGMASGIYVAVVSQLSVCCLVAALVGMASGCATDEGAVQRVPDSPFGAPVVPPAPTRASFAPASTAAAARVDTIGRGILGANPQTGLRPLFVTIGAPQPEIFHRGTADIDITEGLVNQCASDGQLAAILCQELGKMVAEREALSSPRSRVNDGPPPAVRITNDSGSDLTYLAEQAKYRAPAAREAPRIMPDPQALARDYLTKAGYPPTELDNAEPLLRQAAANARLEKQFINPGPARPWTN